jgi:parallel beta-helix repeat protein
MDTRHPVVRLLIPVIVSLMVGGCSDDEDSPAAPTPVTGLSIEPGSMDLEISRTVTVTATVTGGDTRQVGWYVDGVLGGDEEVGIITQSNPASYTSPDSVPDSVSVLIRAVSLEDTTHSDTCRVHVSFTTVYANATAGNDESGSGGYEKPVKSITRALALASAELAGDAPDHRSNSTQPPTGVTISVAAGVYDNANGEDFPLELTDNISIVGDDWETTIIRGDYSGSSYNLAVDITGTDCALRKLTLEQSESAANDWRLAIHAHGNAARVHIDSIRVLERPLYGVIRVWKIPDTLVENCVLTVDDGEEQSHGIELQGNQENTILRNCTISGFWYGMTIADLANPLIENCRFENNSTGLLVGFAGQPEDDANPDLGGGARQSAGGNVIRNNSSCGIRNETTHAIYAIGNTWTNDPPTPEEDHCNMFGGSVIWE